MQDDFLNRPKTISLDVQQIGWGILSHFLSSTCVAALVSMVTQLPRLAGLSSSQETPISYKSWLTLISGSLYLFAKWEQWPTHIPELQPSVIPGRGLGPYLCLKEGRGTGSRTRNLGPAPRGSGGRQWWREGARRQSSNHLMKDISLSK